MNDQQQSRADALTDLLPCPHCGHAAQIVTGDGPFFGRVQVECRSCRIATFWYDEAAAVRQWNRRVAASPSSQPAAAPIPYDGLTEEFTDEVARLADDAPGIREAVSAALENCNAIIAPQGNAAPAPADERAAPDVPEKRHATDPEQQWQQFWREICTNADGSINLEQVKKELSDFSMLLSWVPRVYMHVTGGKVSKENTWPSVVISLHDEHVNELVEEAVRSELEARAASANETGAEGVPLAMALNPNAPPLTMTLGPAQAAEPVAWMVLAANTRQPCEVTLYKSETEALRQDCVIPLYAINRSKS